MLIHHIIALIRLEMKRFTFYRLFLYLLNNWVVVLKQCSHRAITGGDTSLDHCCRCPMFNVYTQYRYQAPPSLTD